MLWSGTLVGSAGHLHLQPRFWLQPSALLGKRQSLGKASRAAGCLQQSSREQQKWPHDPGRQEVPASQPLHSPGPHRAMELPGKNPAWALGCLASLWSLKLMLRVQSLSFLHVKGKAMGGRAIHGSVGTFQWCRRAGCGAGSLHWARYPAPGLPLPRTQSSSSASLPALSSGDYLFCDSEAFPQLPPKCQ